MDNRRLYCLQKAAVALYPKEVHRQIELNLWPSNVESCLIKVDPGLLVLGFSIVQGRQHPVALWLEPQVEFGVTLASPLWILGGGSYV